MNKPLITLILIEAIQILNLFFLARTFPEVSIIISIICWTGALGVVVGALGVVVGALGVVVGALGVGALGVAVVGAVVVGALGVAVVVGALGVAVVVGALGVAVVVAVEEDTKPNKIKRCKACKQEIRNE